MCDLNLWRVFFIENVYLVKIRIQNTELDSDSKHRTIPNAIQLALLKQAQIEHSNSTAPLHIP